MVRIIKVMQPKHAESMSPWIRDFRDRACAISLPQLSSFLSSFPTRWPFPRGDLYHWITLLNRFDSVLDQFCNLYKLDEGPQVVEFGTALLDADHLESNPEVCKDADRLLIEAILHFSRILLLNCGNRSIYASSAHLNSLLNTTSLSLLECTLMLGSELAQRYQAATKRLSIPTRHINTPLLQSHYNISLERVQQLSLPFSKTVTCPAEVTQPNIPTTPSSKGKEKISSINMSTPPQKITSTTIYANDLVSLIKGGSGIGNSPKSTRNSLKNGASSSSEMSWNEWGDVKIIFYPKSLPDGDGPGASSIPATHSSSVVPTTPTSVRRSSNLGPRGQRSTKQTTTDMSPGSAPSPTFLQPTDDNPRQSFKVIEISSSKLISIDIHTLLLENISSLPQEHHYELLTKLRVAQALTSSLETRRQILAIRLLAITNLAYIYLEGPFQELVLKQDNEEPRRLQLVYQLAELVHPPTDGGLAVPRNLQALAFAALDALQGHQSKLSDVCAALNTNVNHGVLLYVLRKAVAEMEVNDSGDKITIDDEWRGSLFSLLSSLSMTARTAVDLVTAGLIQILVEILNQRTDIAERYQPMVLTFLDTIMYSARDSFQTLVNAEGLDAISSLIVHEVKTATENARLGKGTQVEYRSSIVDYEIPFFQQQTLKWLFKFIHHLMSAAGGFGGNFDRLLRNLIDSSQLLSSLRQIIGNTHCFGSIVWTNAVCILNDFINNEPTSFAVIAEAGLSRGLLEAVTGKPIIMSDEPRMGTASQPVNGSSPSRSSDDDDSDEGTTHVERLSLNMLQAPRQGPLAGGILPTSETINIVPQAFSAICLNTSGMKMFQASKALGTFFEIFESPEHVKCMDNHKDLPASLGSSFDELARHHPSLKTSIITAILNMVARVEYLCASEAKNNMAGAKLWTTNSTGQTIVATGAASNPPLNLKAERKNSHDGSDVEMKDVDAESTYSVSTKVAPSSSSMQINLTPYVCATINFLYAILANSSIRTEFCSSGGIDYVLRLSQSPALEFDFWESSISLTIQQVIAMLAESKPHLTLPKLLKRASSATEQLRLFTQHDGDTAFFAAFVSSEARAFADVELISSGTSFVKALVSIHSLVSTIPNCIQNSPYNHRNSPSIFNQINVADYYIQLVRDLGPILGSSLREAVKLRNLVPDHWKDATRSKDSTNSVLSRHLLTGSNIVHTMETGEPLSPTSSSIPAIADELSPAPRNAASTDPKPLTPPTSDKESPEFKNYITLRFLLKKLPRIISPFFQTLGKTLLAKRTLDSFQKQCHFAIADALAETVLAQLTIDETCHSADTYTYWLGMIAVLHELLMESSRQMERPSQIITLVVQSFKDQGGFDRLNKILSIFADEICRHGTQSPTEKVSLRLELANSGALSILSLYGHLVNGKSFIEAAQTAALIARAERDRRGSEFFSASQFLVELRMIILPTIRRLWSSVLIENGSTQISEKLIAVIRSIAAADSEATAIKRSDKPLAPYKPTHKTFKINQDFFNILKEQGYSDSLASEALYRCNNSVNFALEYCRELRDVDDEAGRNPVPEKDTDTPASASASARVLSRLPPTDHSNPSNSVIHNTSQPDIVSEIVDTFNGIETLRGDDESGNMDLALTSLTQAGDQEENDASGSTSTILPPIKPSENQDHTQVTVDDLNEERSGISENLIDKCLDVINAHGEVTFEVADLIMTVVSKSSDPAAQRKAVGQTLVVALMSFAAEDDLGKCGKKIAAYAHLLALMLRDKLFFSATVGVLKENLGTLLLFIKNSPQHLPKEPSPWIAHILLIIEMLLSHDEKPQKTIWTPPRDENSVADPPVVESRDLSVLSEQRSQLLEVILEILPRIGKDEPLALSVLRILVILTRSREMAQTMGEKKNIQRLFVMTKQLAGASSARIQSPLMLILRHIIEDTETVKQIMKAEIKASLEPSRAQRNVDEKSYLRGLAYTALRNPDLFVQVTSEMVKFNRWPYPSSDSPSRHHTLVLKEASSDAPQIPPIDSVLPTAHATEGLSIEELKPSMEAIDSEMHDVLKPNHEQKLPVVENPDGVIHFLLCELMNYRDVDDKDSAVVPISLSEKCNVLGNDDVSMSGTSMPPLPTTTSKDSKNTKANSKPDFKAEEHPIYIYRCFILQCLTELLSSYNRTKIEFINFKRSAPPQAMTPSKPRSSVVNYLLFDLIPIGTLDHIESNYLRKKVVTSSWADSVITALLSKTGERPIDKSRDPYDSEVEPDLLFVRRFVLENILKAYKEASSSNEPLDLKYSRMLALADLMSHIMQGKENVGISHQAIAATSQKQLRRIMFDKGYISALTSSIAEIDLNFPNAKRAVKYILRPLKTLTTTAINLSDLSLISTTPGQGDEEEIESATSISEQEDEREETPDLFRNSTLGMFEHGVEDSESDDNDDEDMDGAYNEYGDEMDYDDGDMDDDDEDNISEEDDIEGIGPIEGLSGDHGVEVEVIMDDHNDDDDDSSADEDDEPDSNDDDDEDDDHRVEIIEELEEIQQQLDDDDEDLAGEWDSGAEDDEGAVDDDFDDQYEDPEDSTAIDIGAMGHLVRALGDDPAAIEMLGRLAEVEEHDGEHVVADYAEDDDEHDDNEDADEDEDDMFDAQYPSMSHFPDLQFISQEIVSAAVENVTFGWPQDIETTMAGRHRPRGGFSSFPSFPGGPRDPLDVTNLAYRSHRPGVSIPRTADDGINPLLQRNRSEAGISSSRPPMLGTWVPAIRGPPGSDLLDIGFSTQGGPIGDGPATAQFLEDVIRTLPLPGHFGRNGQALQFHITTGPVTRHLPTELEAFFGSRHPRFEERRHAPEPGNAAIFTPQSTAARWSEESKILFGSTWVERAGDMAGTLLSILVPPAIDVDKAIKAAQLEKARQEQQEADRKAEEERIANEAKAAEEELAREKEERDREATGRAAERIAIEPLQALGENTEVDHEDSNVVPDSMEGVETEGPEIATPVVDSSTENRPRATATIRGNTFDITDLGIDAEFLAELPEEIREEVIMSAVAERRSQAAAIGAQPSEIDQEFLNALPDDIREEIIQQERQDRRRREREERNRQVTAANGVTSLGDMDAATILATLDPAFRNQVLMEQDDATLALLPPEMASRARAALRDHPNHARLPNATILRRAASGYPSHPNGSRNSNTQRPSRRSIVQMLDKPGVATLLRLMFIFQHGSLRTTLNAVLQNVSMNRLNRHEVLSTILHILQDGSVDMTAVERSFAHLSLRAKQPKDALPKVPQPLKRNFTGLVLLAQTNFEASPLMVVSQCLTALIYLNQVNQHVSTFFLTEHDAFGGLKRTLSRKGKAKENKASKFAINSLLGLLDRQLIMESSSVMESLSTLLNMITSPLQVLQRKQKIAEESAAEGTTTIQDSAGSTTFPDARSRNDEQYSEPNLEANSSDPGITTHVASVQPDLVSSAEGEPSTPADVTINNSEAPKQPEKKQRPITPPVIPEHNLKLVINIFVARECSSKTFRETLSTIKNLSAIPDAKTVFGHELISKAQSLGEIILVDLQDLYPQIQKATTGTEIQGVALAKFSPGGSDQNKLLRVLTALDHLFDPKREKKEKADENETENESSQLVVKHDLLSSLYENPTFARMWQKLSACLNSIRQREHMLNVATILLPLIEALMVVCKNTTMKDTSISKSQIGKDWGLTSPPPHSRMESLFYTFTEEHRKILNDLVRNTPKLMSGTFSLLVKNPKVLEFDNKRNYFNRSIHTKASNSRETFPPLQLSVRRDLVFHDSFKSLYFQSGDQMKYGKLSIRFHGEEGVDAGGVTREWFQVLSRQMFDPGYALFIPVSSDRTTFHPNQLSSVNEEHLMFFKFIGRVIGKALYEGRVLDCHFSRAVYKRILGKAVSVKDMESLDPDYYKSLVWMLENDITDIITETFSIDNDKFGVNETIDFIPNGRNIAVTEENKHEYARLMVEWKLTGSVKEQLDEFLKDLVSIFNEQELELLISGLPEIDVDDWKGNTEYHNYSTSSTQIQWFWRAVRSFDKEERAKLLQFVTGTSKVPLNGFKELEGMNGFSRFNIHRDYGNKNRLPSSHTCFNQLDIPEYESYEILRQQLLTAITAGSEYFGFA